MFSNESINKNKEAAIIDGPDDVLNSKEENNRAQAPANTVIPQSNPRLSGVIKNYK